MYHIEDNIEDSRGDVGKIVEIGKCGNSTIYCVMYEDEQKGKSFQWLGLVDIRRVL